MSPSTTSAQNISTKTLSQPQNFQNDKLAALQRQGNLKITRKTITPTPPVKVVQNDEPEEYDLNDLFPKRSAPPSPPRELTLCPITGKVLGQAEGEPTPPTSPEPHIDVPKPIAQTMVNLLLTDFRYVLEIIFYYTFLHRNRHQLLIYRRPSMMLANCNRF